jgi:hypothetical protein
MRIRYQAPVFHVLQRTPDVGVDEVDHLRGRWREARDAHLVVDEQRGHAGAGEQVVHVVVDSREVEHLVLQLGVHGREFLVHRLQLLLRRLELLVGGLQLFVDRLHLLVGGLQLCEMRHPIAAVAPQVQRAIGQREVVVGPDDVRAVRLHRHAVGGLEHAHARVALHQLRQQAYART